MQREPVETQPCPSAMFSGPQIAVSKAVWGLLWARQSAVFIAELF